MHIIDWSDDVMRRLKYVADEYTKWKEQQMATIADLKLALKTLKEITNPSKRIQNEIADLKYRIQKAEDN